MVNKYVLNAETKHTKEDHVKLHKINHSNKPSDNIRYFKTIIKS